MGEKVLTHLSKHIPKEGFVHGKDAPSTADLVILVLTQALIPFGATLGEGAAECYGKFPSAVALGERAAAFPAVAKWLTRTLQPQEATKGCPQVRALGAAPPFLGPRLFFHFLRQRRAQVRGQRCFGVASALFGVSDALGGFFLRR